MSDCSCHPYYNLACEYVVPIKLAIPIFLEPQVLFKSTCVREKLPVHLQPEIHLEPEVRANQPVCVPQNGYSHDVLLGATEN